MTHNKQPQSARSGTRPHGDAQRKPFSASRSRFEGIVATLLSDETGRMTHRELEDLLHTDGMALLRQLYQDHLDLRADREVRLDSVAGSDGKTRGHHRAETSRALMTVFGVVRPRGRTYEGRGMNALRPADAALNLPREKHSHGLQRRVAYEVSKGSFEDAVESIDRTTAGHVPKRQAEEIARRTAADFETFYKERKGLVPSKEASILVTTFDGKGVVVRREDLRETTRKKAEKTNRKLKTRLSPGEKEHRKRMACVAAVYAIAPHVRSPEEILANGKPAVATEKRRRPKPEGKRVWASLRDPPEAVIADAFAEAEARDPDHKLDWVTLVDGNENQIRLAQAFAELSGHSVTIIVDLIHVSEYLWKAAIALHGGSGPSAEEWMQERLLRVLRGEASQVAAGMRRSATKRQLSATSRKPIDTCANYLLKYKPFLRYDAYLAAGFPIATGIIEGACRHLVKDRMDVPGEWSLDGAEAVLRLRALRCSGDFDEYWLHHENAEFLRNHLGAYANGEVPDPWPGPSADNHRRRHLSVVK